MSVQAEKLASRLAGEGVAVEVLPTNPRPPRGLRFVAAVPGLRTAVREAQYLFLLARKLPQGGVVHHFSASGLYFFMHSVPLLLLAYLGKNRVVLNYRGGKAAAFLERWGWLAAPLLRRADYIAVPSEYLRRVFREHGLAASLLPNLADIELLPYRERASLAPRLIVTRQLEPMYNLECVLRAFRIVRRRFPQAELAVAGAGSEEARLRGLVEEWGLRGVRFHGAVPPRDLAQLYAANDIFVNASLVDNFPAALVEAACCGLPIITSKAGGIPDMIRDRVHGRLVELNDHEALAGAVIELLERPDYARQLAAAARRWAEHFSWENVFPSLLSHYGFDKRPPADRRALAEEPVSRVGRGVGA